MVSEVSHPTQHEALRWHLFLPVALLALAGLSATALGAAWAWLAVFGMWQAWRQRRQLPHILQKQPALWLWLLACLLGFAAKAAATLFWHDSWQERHGEIRLLLGAMACCGLYTYSLSVPGQRFRAVTWLSHALSLAALTGLIWVTWKGRGYTPTHPIPWAGIMAMLSCWLLAVGLDKQYPARHRQLWLAGGMLALLAVLASQSRGAFVVLLWWAAVWAYRAWWGFRQSAQKLRSLRRLVGVMANVGLALVALAYTPVLERPRASLRDALNEAQLSLQSPAAASNSSVGSRMYMWQRSLSAIAEAPWLGHGGQARRQLLQQWARDAQSTEIAGLAHLHNEYLNQLIDHGLLGFASQLSYLFGLLVVARHFHRSGQHTGAMTVAGIGVIYTVGNMGNVNFAHNYYTAGLSLMAGLAISLLSKPLYGRTPHAPS